MEVFYEHDSDDKLIAKKDALELSNWIEHLVNNGRELEILINIAKKLSNDDDMIGNLKELTLENKLHLGVFYRYKSSMVNLHECEDMECDIYYVNKHEEYRNLYAGILQASHKLKEKLYTQILGKLWSCFVSSLFVGFNIRVLAVNAQGKAMLSLVFLGISSAIVRLVPCNCHWFPIGVKSIIFL